MRDCVAGSQAIKTRRPISEGTNDNKNVELLAAAGTRYLPAPNPADIGHENTIRYEQYKTRANFVNFTGHTKDGFLGMVYRKTPEIELAQGLEFLEENADGEGLSLLQMLQGTTSDVLETGRHGILTDFPPSAGGTQAQTQGLTAKLTQYPAESIINWRTAVISSHTQNVLIVLAEEVEKHSADGFAVEIVTHHRVLTFNEDGQYVQRMYDEDDKIMVLEDGTTDLIPRKSDNSTWDTIPFVFIGAMDNSPTPDKAPLYDLGELNVSHYRNSADFEESSFMVGQPTPVFTGLTKAWADEVMKVGVTIGSRGAVLLPEGGAASLMQANANQMPSEGMLLKEKQMIQIGAKVITDTTGVETAEAAKIRFAGQNSKLSLALNNIERAFLQSLEWAGEFMTGDGESELHINRQFYEATVNPQLLVANMQLLDRGVIGKSDLRNNMRKSGQIEQDRSDEDIDLEVGDVDPLA